MSARRRRLLVGRSRCGSGLLFECHGAILQNVVHPENPRGTSANHGSVRGSSCITARGKAESNGRDRSPHLARGVADARFTEQRQCPETLNPTNSLTTRGLKFVRRGVTWLDRARRAFVGGETGLGKARCIPLPPSSLHRPPRRKTRRRDTLADVQPSGGMLRRTDAPVGEQEERGECCGEHEHHGSDRHRPAAQKGHGAGVAHGIGGVAGLQVEAVLHDA